MGQVVPFSEDSVALPAHLRGTFGDTQNNELSGGVSTGYPIISFKGKTWSLREGGESTVIMRPGTDDEPASSLEVVIVKANPNLSKVYYPNGYSEGSDEKPACYSNDGLHPAGDAQHPQCSNCAACPNNAWGSRITENGSKGKACSDSRRVAVAPSGELNRPMLLRVPAATLKDLAQYADMLTRRNAPYQAVVTKIGFDTSVAHPKLTFKATRWLEAAEAAEVAKLMNAEIIGTIIGTSARPSTEQPRLVQKTQAADVSELGERPASAPVVQAAPAPAKVEKPKAAKPKTTGFAAPAAAPKEDPAQSRASARLVQANEELDAALAELDDVG